ncbi:helix-turn-helix domain-containing protein [Nonomuraea sp. NPDC046802]|uniref:TetR/AcrR family transcriptional regulator n=1 Tax=Nonomuraea sp. NPDC046802 TaxID=3154919 RepID=UPI0033D31D06
MGHLVRTRSTRSLIMRTAERLYAAEGFANVSIRQIGEAAGQRNKSAVQYHFSGRDELIKAILAEHAEAIERHRLALLTPLGEPGPLPLREQLRCVVLPHVEHHIDLGTPSWYGRFLAQVIVEPALRDYAVSAHLHTPSLRRLYDAIRARRGADGRASRRLGAGDGRLRAGDGRLGAGRLGTRREDMARQLIVHMCAQLEAELAREQPIPELAAASWRSLGSDLVTALHGLVQALDG